MLWWYWEVHLSSNIHILYWLPQEVSHIIFELYRLIDIPGFYLLQFKTRGSAHAHNAWFPSRTSIRSDSWVTYQQDYRTFILTFSRRSSMLGRPSTSLESPWRAWLSYWRPICWYPLWWVLGHLFSIKVSMDDQNTFTERLSQIGFNIYPSLVVDIHIAWVWSGSPEVVPAAHIQNHLQDWPCLYQYPQSKVCLGCYLVTKLTFFRIDFALFLHLDWTPFIASQMMSLTLVSAQHGTLKMSYR